MRDINTVKVLGIVDGTSVDGPGLRTSIYLAGCSHHCPGCHNPESWDYSAGKSMTAVELLEHISEQDFDVTFSGGDPMEHVDFLAPLLEQIKSDGRNIWCYTGYTYEQVLMDSKRSELLEWIDVLVDGRFEQEYRDISLRFKGSSNQRLVDVRRSSLYGKVIEWSED